MKAVATGTCMQHTEPIVISKEWETNENAPPFAVSKCPTCQNPVPLTIIVTQDPDILVDTREPPELFEKIRASLSEKGLRVTQETLSTDFLIKGSPGWVIERKNVQDFYGTWMGDRLADQLRTLKMYEGAGYKPAVMIVGNPWAVVKFRKINPAALMNMINSISVSWGIHVLWCLNESLISATLAYVAGKAKGERNEMPMRRAAGRELEPYQQAIHVLQGFPGMGVVTTEKVRGETETLFEFTEKVGTNPALGAGVGLTLKQQQRIYEVLHADWSKKENDKPETN